MPEDAEMQDQQRADRALRRLLRSFRSADSYGLVLVMIVITYALAVLLPEGWAMPIIILAQIGTVWLALHTSLARPRLLGAAGALFALALVTAVIGLYAPSGSTLRGLVFLAGSLLYFVAPIAIVRHIGSRRIVDQETLLGALAAYLCFGMAFAFVYRFLGEIQGGDFFGADGDGLMSEDLFFSFVTLTTTGYGNLVPAGNPGQSFAVVEALLGQLFLVTAVAKIISAWRPRAWGDSLPDSAGPPEEGSISPGG
jgi:hypothetical protein